MTTSINNLPNTGSTQIPNQQNPPPRNLQISNDNINSVINDIQQSGGNALSLPQRDMPNNTSQHITKDEEAKVNYVKKEPQYDYIKEYDNLEEIQKRAQKQESVNSYDEYIPYGFAAILYVIFHMPQVKDLFKKNIPGLFGEDGLPLMSYNIVLAVLFGSLLYTSHKYIIDNI